MRQIKHIKTEFSGTLELFKKKKENQKAEQEEMEMPNRLKLKERWIYR